MQKIQVLIIDDEWNMRNLLRIYLMKSGFEVTEAVNGYEALEVVKHKPFDVIILDVMMPDMDGWQVCKKIRGTLQTPILMLTARTDTKDKVHGLTIGADDYLVKPFEPEELMARIFALLRRSSLADSANVSAAKIVRHVGMEIEPEERQVYIQEQPIDLTPKEFELLFLLANQPKRAFSRDALLEQIWGDDYLGDIRTVDTHVKNLRDKLRKAGLPYNPIQTVWGVGYKFQSSEDRK